MFYLCCWGWGTAMYAYVWLNQVQSSTHTCSTCGTYSCSYFIKLQVLHFAWPAQTTLYFSILGPPIIWGGPLFADLLYFLPTEKINSGFLPTLTVCLIVYVETVWLSFAYVNMLFLELIIWLSFAHVNVLFLEKPVFSTFDWVLPM